MASLPAGAISNLFDATWYANFMAGTFTTIGPLPTLTFDDAICTYRAVPLSTGVIKALNNWAGITDPQLFVGVNQALNLIAVANSVPGAGSLSTSKAMQGIAAALFP